MLHVVKPKWVPSQCLASSKHFSSCLQFVQRGGGETKTYTFNYSAMSTRVCCNSIEKRYYNIFKVLFLFVQTLTFSQSQADTWLFITTKNFRKGEQCLSSVVFGSIELSTLMIWWHIQLLHHTNLNYFNTCSTICECKQSGAVEACWAHNPEVRGSKPRSARFFFKLLIFQVTITYVLSQSRYPSAVQ